MIVSDASPLINLAKVGRLYLLRELFEKVLIEEEVRKESIDRGKEEGASDAFLIEKALKEGWIEVHAIKKEKNIIGLHRGRTIPFCWQGNKNVLCLSMKRTEEKLQERWD